MWDSGCCHQISIPDGSLLSLAGCGAYSGFTFHSNKHCGLRIAHAVSVSKLTADFVIGSIDREY